MEQTNDLNEYVLNETGRIFYGTEEQIAERSWNYGQVPKNTRIHPKIEGGGTRNGGFDPENPKVWAQNVEIWAKNVEMWAQNGGTGTPKWGVRPKNPKV